MAGLNVPLPTCEARTVTVPVPFSVTTLLFNVTSSWPDTTLKVTGNPELADPTNANAGFVTNMSTKGAKVITCAALVTVKD